MTVLKKVIPEKEYTYYKYLWECICACGKLKITDRCALVNGRCRSCGCLHSESAKRNAINNRKKKKLKPLKDMVINKNFRDYQKSAKIREHDFNLTKEEFSTLVLMDSCFYCGSSEKTPHKSKVQGSKEIFFLMGVDRVDNSKGYSVDNCVPCCKKCNIGKLDMDLEVFYDWIGRVYSNIKEKRTYMLTPIDELYKKAFMTKLRFESSKGNLMVEDLFDLSLRDLDRMAQEVNRKLRDEGEDSFLANAKKPPSQNSLRLALLKDVIETKEAVAAVAKSRAEKQAQISQIRELVQAKQNEAMAGKSVEELMKQLAELEAAVV